MMQLKTIVGQPLAETVSIWEAVSVDALTTREKIIQFPGRISIRLVI